MKKTLRNTLCLAPVLLTTSLFAQQPRPTDAATRLATQNALFEESWQTTLRLSPTLATAVGDYRYNDQLGDNSLAAIARRHDINTAYLARIKAISTIGFSDQDILSHDLFLRNLQEGLED